MNMEETKLIKDLQDGSRAAFNALYEMYCGRLYAFCYQYTKSREDSEEIVQDVFVKLWTHRGEIDADTYGTCAYFLFRLMKNQLINRYKALINSPVFEEYTNVLSSEESHDTARTIEYREFKETLSSIIQRLPQTQRNVARCRLLEELNTEETAQRLSLSEQTIRNQFSLALKIIREQLYKLGFVWAVTLLQSVIKP